MTSLDSRVLQKINCYARKFSKPGKVIYRIGAAAGSCALDKDASFTIAVEKSTKKESQQHNVSVRLEHRTLVAEPGRFSIQAGDMVLWHAQDKGVHVFSVYGEAPEGRFSSGSLDKEVVFTHAFGRAGTYEWMDANGSSVRGVVEVVSPDRESTSDCDEWIESLANGVVVHVVGKKVRPEKVQIRVGQTVFWAVEEAPGITITDRRLLGESEPGKSGRRK